LWALPGGAAVVLFGVSPAGCGPSGVPVPPVSHVYHFMQCQYRWPFLFFRSFGWLHGISFSVYICDLWVCNAVGRSASLVCGWCTPSCFAPSGYLWFSGSLLFHFSKWMSVNFITYFDLKSDVLSQSKEAGLLYWIF
jgi:hypothetical protein